METTGTLAFGFVVFRGLQPWSTKTGGKTLQGHKTPFNQPIFNACRGL